MGAPAVSVIIPAYDAESTILETIASVRAQTYTNLEILVIDDGSTDATVARVRSVDDPRVRVFSYPHAGLAAARNRGLERSTGAFVSFIDAPLVPELRASAIAARICFLCNEYPPGPHGGIGTCTQRSAARWRRPGIACASSGPILPTTPASPRDRRGRRGLALARRRASSGKPSCGTGCSARSRAGPAAARSTSSRRRIGKAPSRSGRRYPYP
jgi:glycosyltransferase involved in cell wall biosynthesis